MEDIIYHLGKQGVVGIIRGDFSLAQLQAITETIAEGGVTVMEITLNTTNALTAVAQLRQQYDGQIIIGTGTVRTVAQLKQSIEAGAQFSVAPNFDRETVETAVAQQFLHLPGIFTATEAETAWRAGCRLLKLFPSDMMGPGYLKALRAPLDDVQFVPTGGITPTNIGDYRRAGAFACGIGSALVTGPEQPLPELKQRATALREAWEAAA